MQIEKATTHYFDDEYSMRNYHEFISSSYAERELILESGKSREKDNLFLEAWRIVATIREKLLELPVAPMSIMVAGSLITGTSNFEEEASWYNSTFYNVSLDNDGEVDNLALEKHTDGRPFTLSDIDIEVIYSSKDLPPKSTIASIINEAHSTRSGSARFPVEVSVYSADELVQFMNNHSGDEPNYIIHRFLLTPVTEIYGDSLNSMRNWAERQIEIDTAFLDLEIGQHPSILHAAGYAPFKEHKNTMRQLPVGESMDIPINEICIPEKYYLQHKAKNTAQAGSPFTLKNGESYKVVFPPKPLFPQAGRNNDYVIASPPLPAYETNIHIGSLMTATIADVEARYQTMLGKSVRINPHTFQGSGRYWEKPETLGVGVDEIDTILRGNRQEILSQIVELNLLSSGFPTHDSDALQKTLLRVMVTALEKNGWLSKGYSQHRRDERALFFEAGRLIAAYGGPERLLEKIVMVPTHLQTQLVDTLAMYAGQRGQQNTSIGYKQIEMSGGGRTGTEVVALNENFSLFPIISILGLPLSSMEDHTSFDLALSGINVATQWLLGLLLFYQGVGIDYPIKKLHAHTVLLDSQNIVIQARNNNVIFISELADRFREVLPKNERSDGMIANHHDFLARYWILMHQKTTSKSTKVDFRNVIPAAKLLVSIDSLNSAFVQLGYSQTISELDIKAPDGFHTLMQNMDFRQALLLVESEVRAVQKVVTNPENWENAAKFDNFNSHYVRYLSAKELLKLFCPSTK